MKNEILLDAIGKIDEELVFAAEKGKKKKFPFIKWATAAAIFAVIIFGKQKRCAPDQLCYVTVNHFQVLRLRNIYSLSYFGQGYFNTKRKPCQSKKKEKKKRAA